MTTQAAPEEIELPERAFDIRGQVFGMLTVLRPVDNTQRGVIWLCECECGRHAIRSAASLRQAAKNNCESQCAECQRELKRGTAEDQVRRWREIHLLCWYEHGGLYTDRQIEAIKHFIEEDLLAIDFPIGEPLKDESDGHGYTQPEPYEGICDGHEYKLREIGAEFHVSRERVRQMCLTAEQHLLNKHRRLLVSLLTGEFDRHAADVEFVKANPSFAGCRCKSYAKSTPRHIYCKTCGQVWTVSEAQADQILLDKVTVVEDTTNWG